MTLSMTFHCFMTKVKAFVPTVVSKQSFDNIFQHNNAWNRCLFLFLLKLKPVNFRLICYFFQIANLLPFYFLKANCFSMTFTKIPRLSRPGNWNHKFHDFLGFPTGRPHKRRVWLFVWNIKKCMEEYWRVLYRQVISRNGQVKAQNKCKPTSIAVCCLFCGSTWRIWAILWVLCWLLLYVIRRRPGWKAHFRLFQRQADFHPEIRIARLPNRTPDKLKGWRFF